MCIRDRDKPEIEEIIPLLNGMDLPVWFDKYSIALGDSITDKVQEGIQQSSICLLYTSAGVPSSQRGRTSRSVSHTPRERMS